jgi:hypothetical protein
MCVGGGGTTVPPHKLHMPFLITDSFDREYKRTYRYLHRDGNSGTYPLTNEDHPLPARAMWCRRAFKPPTLQPRLPPSRYFLSQGLISED